MIANVSFNDDFQNAIRYSREAALKLGCDVIGSDHLLLGILHDAGDRAHGILSKYIDDIDGFAATLAAKYPDPVPVAMNNVPLTDEAENVVNGSIAECESLNSDSVGTEHILLALLRNEQSETYQALRGRNITYDTILADVQ